MFFFASLSGKNISYFSLDSGKILSILRYCLEMHLSKVCTNPDISIYSIIQYSNVYITWFTQGEKTLY